MENTVSVARAQNFSHEGIKRAVYCAIDSLSFATVKVPRKVSLKVNLCYYWDPSTGETTDPRVVSSVVDYIRERWNKEASISVIESDASAVRASYAFRMLGYEKLAAEKNIRLSNLSKEPSRKTTVSSGGKAFTFRVPQSISESDLFISIPKPKYHVTGISCALKNQFGCNPAQRKFLLHPMLNEAIVALNKIMMPNLILLDGIIVRGVNSRKLGLIMASTNPVIVDFVMAKIMGLDPSEIDHLNLAIREGLGTVDTINIRGVDINYFKNKFPKMSPPSRLERMTEKMKLSLYNLYLEAVNGIPL